MRSIREFGILLFLSVFLLGIAPAADASPCTPRTPFGNPCGAVVTLSVFTGTPTYPCPSGDDVIEVVIVVTCGGNQETVVEYTCSSFTAGLTFSALGYTHKLVVDGTWGDAEADCRGKLSFSTQ